jgi:hypothetical protein
MQTSIRTERERYDFLKRVLLHAPQSLLDRDTMLKGYYEIICTENFRVQTPQGIDNYQILLQKVSSHIHTHYHNYLKDQSPEDRKKAQEMYSELTSIATGDQLRNVNSYHFLREILDKLPDSVKKRERYQDILKEFYALNGLKKPYNPNTPYGDFYTQVITDLQKNHQKYATNLANATALQNVINYIFLNDNGALDRSFAFIAPTIGTSGSLHQTEKSIASRLKDTSAVNQQTPTNANSSVERAHATFVNPNYQPMLGTRQPCVIHLPFAHDFTIISSGTLAEFVSTGSLMPGQTSKARANPLFVSFLEGQQSPKVPDRITHIYINNLKIQPGELCIKDPKKAAANYERNNERALSLSLHELEKTHPNVAIITLPANDDYLKASFLKKDTDINLSDFRSKIIGMTKSDSANLDNMKGDFYISTHVRKQLFGVDTNGNLDKKAEDKTLNGLFNESLKDLGFEGKEKLTSQEAQALYFHFIKFRLTDHIISMINPQTINFSCKDGIDRGGVSSAYFILIKSIKMGTPLSEDEFNQAIHAASAMVKGRGMNEHSEILLNAISLWVKNQENMPIQQNNAANEQSKAYKPPDWLKTWISKYENATAVEKQSNTSKTTSWRSWVSGLRKSAEEAVTSAIGPTTGVK